MTSKSADVAQKLDLFKNYITKILFFEKFEKKISVIYYLGITFTNKKSF